MKKRVALLLTIVFFAIFYINLPKKKDFISQISSTLEPSEKWENEISSPILDQVLTQKFTYLSRGTQSYVFESQDQKYVIKFIKMNHLTPNKWLKYLPAPLLGKLKYKKVFQREQKLNQLFDSLQYAYHHFKDESGLLFSHINRTKNWNKKIHLVGKKGETFTLSLDDIPFMIQEKAELVYSKLFRLIETKNNEDAKNCVRALLNLVWTRGCRGLFDHDRSVSNNFGFVNEKPIQFDIGGLYLIDSEKKLQAAAEEVHRIGQRIGIKIKETRPEFLSIYQEVLHEFNTEI